jgi:hypothetical protein
MPPRPTSETIQTRFGANWVARRPMGSRFNPEELYSRARTWSVREQGRERGLDSGTWDVLGGSEVWPMTNVRDLKLPQWRRLAAHSENRRLTR